LFGFGIGAMNQDQRSHISISSLLLSSLFAKLESTL